jgi:hypothetical protein
MNKNILIMLLVVLVLASPVFSVDSCEVLGEGWSCQCSTSKLTLANCEANNGECQSGRCSSAATKDFYCCKGEMAKNYGISETYTLPAPQDSQSVSDVLSKFKSCYSERGRGNTVLCLEENEPATRELIAKLITLDFNGKDYGAVNKRTMDFEVSGNAILDEAIVYYSIAKMKREFELIGITKVDKIDIEQTLKELEAAGKDTSYLNRETKDISPCAPISGKLTAYSPQDGGDPTEGGYDSSIDGPGGQNVVMTLNDFHKGYSEYITLAGNPSYYNKEYTIPKIKFINLALEAITLVNVRAVVHDTGPSFTSAQEGRFDIPVDRDLIDSVLEVNHEQWASDGVQLIPKDCGKTIPAPALGGKACQRDSDCKQAEPYELHICDTGPMTTATLFLNEDCVNDRCVAMEGHICGVEEYTCDGFFSWISDVKATIVPEAILLQCASGTECKKTGEDVDQHTVGETSVKGALSDEPNVFKCLPINEEEDYSFPDVL